ncbi:uncharacterized protein K452DRAFT_357358 [Aplosporella prunicola CBS 121167]|uniref:Uncharacterized protein n=1 Tax=Aplosporella prunicola CBS 121167 TaxID=1176127 RepID=A0A6A6BKC2_9PEZI|nr:uncharacterized protein K452DRAFT_357358 [Aplosporella prunicola CBS 121167]KAF2143734.1 hypothetical protein K452DRAFT_357358 [Aplosporella prunicola CBS 121167]
MAETKKSFWKSAGDTILNFISPSKTQHRRDKPYKARHPNRKRLRHHHDKNKVATRQSSEPLMFSKTTGSPRSISNSPDLYTQQDEEDALEKTNLVTETPEEDTSNEEDDDTSTLNTPKPTIKKSIGHFTSPEYKRTIRRDTTIVLPEEEWDERHAKDFKLDLARTRRHNDAQRLREAGWGEDPIALWVKLAMRGYEPLLPHNWMLDFETLSPMLFAPRHSRAYIRAVHGNDFRAIKALQSLIFIGARARDAIHPKVLSPPSRSPEELIRREIERYSRWAFADGGVSSDSIIPVLAMISGAESVSPDILETRIKAHLASLCAEWRAALHVVNGEDGHDTSEQLFTAPPPEVYGVVVWGTKAGFIIYADGGKEPRTEVIATFDFGVAEYDVWTSLAIAILVVHCRKVLLKMKGVMGVVESVEKTGEDDPDA